MKESAMKYFILTNNSKRKQGFETFNQALDDGKFLLLFCVCVCVFFFLVGFDTDPHKLFFLASEKI